MRNVGYKLLAAFFGTADGCRHRGEASGQLSDLILPLAVQLNLIVAICDLSRRFGQFFDGIDDIAAEHNDQKQAGDEGAADKCSHNETNFAYLLLQIGPYEQCRAASWRFHGNAGCVAKTVDEEGKYLQSVIIIVHSLIEFAAHHKLVLLIA